MGSLAADVQLPPVDSQNVWPLIIRTSNESVRTITHLSNSAIMNDQGWKLIVSQCLQVGESFKCDVTNSDVWTPPVYPNASQPNGLPTSAMNSGMDCRSGCLFNVLHDPQE